MISTYYIHLRSHELVSRWTWIRNDHACQQVDTLITLWRHFGNKIISSFSSSPHTFIPRLTPHVSVSNWELLAQNHAMFSKAAIDLRQWWWLGTQLENDYELWRRLSKSIIGCVYHHFLCAEFKVSKRGLETPFRDAERRVRLSPLFWCRIKVSKQLSGWFLQMINAKLFWLGG